jgi:hypothetical protein
MPRLASKETYTDEETHSATTLLSLFSRFIEITCNVFFYAVESREFGSISPTRDECFERMKSKAIIVETGLWMEMILDAELAHHNPVPKNTIPACNRVLGRYAAEIEEFLERVRPLTAGIRQARTAGDDQT